MDDAVVIGGGPAGLAAAAMLLAKGLRVRVIERAAAIGERWRGHYDRLHLHTTRRLSALPGLAIPRACGRWVSRDDFARYQEDYAAHHAIAVELGTTVERVERAGDAWRVITSGGAIEARFAIVATGFNNQPRVPEWPGAFAGELVHSQRYRNGAAYRGKRVLVVGTGNSGAEIAADLAEHGAEVVWSVRTPPTILPRSVLGIATQALGVMLRPLPPAIVDQIGAAVARLTFGSLTAYGLPRAPRGLYTALLETDAIPILDVGLVDALRRGAVRPVAGVVRLDDRDVVLSDDTRVAPDAVIACTGFRTALEPIVGHLGVLDAHGVPLVDGPRGLADAPGLFFIGYTNVISGNLREIGTHARRLAGVLTAGAIRRRSRDGCP